MMEQHVFPKQSQGIWVLTETKFLIMTPIDKLRKRTSSGVRKVAIIYLLL